MKKLEMIKGAAGLVVSTGVGMIVMHAVKSTSPASMNFLKKVFVGVGTMVLSNMVATKATEHTEEKIDEVVESLKFNYLNYLNYLNEEKVLEEEA